MLAAAGWSRRPISAQQRSSNTTGSPGVNYDQIIVTGSYLRFEGPTTLALAFNSAGSTVDWSDSFWNVNRSWTVFDLTGGETFQGVSRLALGGSLLDSLNNPLSPTARGYFTTSLSGQDVMLNFVAVPEPSTVGIVLSGLVFAAGYRCRKRRATGGR